MSVRSSAVVALLLLALLSLIEVVPANQFYTNGRYGKRTPGPASSVGRLWGVARRRSGEIEPRSDKFFLNSRYGKRAPPAVGPDQEGAVLSPAAVANNVEAEDVTNLDMSLSCQYTGVRDLYRCAERKENIVINDEPQPLNN